jgi:hydrogenase maturation protein HypF
MSSSVDLTGAVSPWRIPTPETILAVGGHLKACFALAAKGTIRTSPVLGDLELPAVRDAYVDAVRAAVDRLDAPPSIVACDRHPDYATSRLAEEWAGAWGADLVRVQHHHAHFAALLLEDGHARADATPIIGIIFDGTGYGEDGTIWGGEFLVGDRRQVVRRARLRPAPLPGGEAAIREPWRLALGRLFDARSLDDSLDPGRVLSRIPAPKRDAVATMIARRLHAPLSSSAGRLFDAVAALVMGHDEASTEAEGAIALQRLAETAPPDAGNEPYPFEILAPERPLAPWTIETRPLILGIVEALGRESSVLIARRFHITLAAMIEATVERLAEEAAVSSPRRVGLSGGVFANRLLTDLTRARLVAAGFEVLEGRAIPCGDAGLALGQINASWKNREADSN